MADVKYVILLLEMARAVDRELSRGISKYARLQSHSRWAFYSDPVSRGTSRTIPRLKDWVAHGIIAYDPTPRHTSAIIESSLPAVTRGIKIPGCPHIVSDSRAISQMAAEHLIERAYTHFGYCGYDDANWSLLRGSYFAQEIKRVGGETTIYEQPRSRKWHSWEKEQSYMAKWLRSLPKPIAILACNDDRARQVIEACKIADIHVPEEIAVLGVDNDEFICELSDPPLPSIAINAEQIGMQAARLLDEMMENNTSSDVEIVVKPTHVVARQSTDMLAIDAPEVAAAINFIRSNARKPIQVNDVVAASTLSRRVLEKRFRIYLRRSILEEINQTHVNQVARMLMETDLSVSDIAVIMGYSSDKHIARSFRKYMGITPLAYRKKYGNHYSRG